MIVDVYQISYLIQVMAKMTAALEQQEEHAKAVSEQMQARARRDDSSQVCSQVSFAL